MKPLTFWQGAALGAAQANTIGGLIVFLIGWADDSRLLVVIGAIAWAVGLLVWHEFGWRLSARGDR